MVLDGKPPPSDEVVSQLQEISITLQTTQNTRLMGDEDVQNFIPRWYLFVCCINVRMFRNQSDSSNPRSEYVLIMSALRGRTSEELGVSQFCLGSDLLIMM